MEIWIRLGGKGPRGRHRWVTYVSEAGHGAAGSEGLADALGVPCQAAAGDATGALGGWGRGGEGGQGREGSSDAEHCELGVFWDEIRSEVFFLRLSNESVDGPVSGIKE